MVRHAQSDDKEPEATNFKLPSEGEHLMQVTDIWEDKNNSDIQVVKLEVVGGKDEGLSILHRVNINDQEKGFYYCRLFLKAFGEPYKGSFDIDQTRWIGRQAYCIIKHNGKYANIDGYDYTKPVEQYKPPVGSNNPGGVTDPKDIAW